MKFMVKFRVYVFTTAPVYARKFVGMIQSLTGLTSYPAGVILKWDSCVQKNAPPAGGYRKPHSFLKDCNSVISPVMLLSLTGVGTGLYWRVTGECRNYRSNLL
jgi:hypothetical protein